MATHVGIPPPRSRPAHRGNAAYLSMRTDDHAEPAAYTRGSRMQLSQGSARDPSTCSQCAEPRLVVAFDYALPVGTLALIADLVMAKAAVRGANTEAA